MPLALESANKVLWDLYNLSRLVFDRGYKKNAFPNIPVFSLRLHGGKRGVDFRVQPSVGTGVPKNAFRWLLYDPLKPPRILD